MTTTTIPLQETGQFKSFFLDYLNKSIPQNWFSEFPSLENFETIIENRNFDSSFRFSLTEIIKNQYKNSNTDLTPLSVINLDLLKETNTFTVTAGHQIVLFTGPLYFLLKIISVINTTEALKKKYPTHNFVPVFWMATEDHDFAEIAQFNFFNQSYVWQADHFKGPVGRIKTSEMSDFLATLPAELDYYKQFYTQNDTLANATRALVNDLFGKYGLLILDPDDEKLKTRINTIFENDAQTGYIQQAIIKQNEQIEHFNYKTQVNGRAFNWFYFEDNDRKRMIVNKDSIQAIESDLNIPLVNTKEWIHENSSFISPNVLTRPLFQELVLPNIAFIGGPAEVIYWLQLKPVFDASNIPFPVLMPRSFAVVLPKNSQAKLDKQQLTISDLFKDTSELKNLIVSKLSTFDWKNEYDFLEQLKNELIIKTNSTDKSLEGYVMAELKKMEKGIDSIKERLNKSSEKRLETEISQIIGIKSKLLPDGHLHERKDSGLSYLINNPLFIEDLKEILDPFLFELNCITQS